MRTNRTLRMTDAEHARAMKVSERDGRSFAQQVRWMFERRRAEQYAEFEQGRAREIEAPAAVWCQWCGEAIQVCDRSPCSPRAQVREASLEAPVPDDVTGCVWCERDIDECDEHPCPKRQAMPGCSHAGPI